MQICRQLAGYSYGRADLVRRAMAKKKHDVMEQERANFIHGKRNEDGSVECVGAVANGVDESTANAIFEEMSSFASYAFNKSHAAAYALVAYQTAYLKCHYVREYMAALLTSVLGNTGKVIEYSAACASCGIQVLPPSVNTSQMGFAVTGGNIRFGLLAVKNLGRNLIQGIIDEREKNGPFRDLPDFIERMYARDLNRRALESLIKSGAFDCFPHNRMEMIRSYERIVDQVDADIRRNIAGQMDLFGNGTVEKTSAAVPKMEDYPLRERLAMEKEVTGLFLSGHPLDDVPVPVNLPIARISDILALGETEEGMDAPAGLYRDGDLVNVLGCVQAKKAMTTKNKSSMAFLTLEDKSGSIELVVFSNLYEPNARWLVKDAILLVTARISAREDEAPKLICESVRNAEHLTPDSRIPDAAKAVSHPAAPAKAAPPKKLYLNFAAQEDPLLPLAMEILGRHRGGDEVILCFADSNKKMALKKYGVIVDKNLLDDLKTVINEQNIAIR